MIVLTETLVVIVDRYRECLLRMLLADDVLVEFFTDIGRSEDICVRGRWRIDVCRTAGV